MGKKRSKEREEKKRKGDKKTITSGPCRGNNHGQ